MSFILKDENNKILTGIMGDGMYYSMEDGNITKHSIIFDDKYYNDMLKHEPIIYDEKTGDKIDIRLLKKVILKI